MLPFDSGKHTISLIPDVSATLLSLEVSKIQENHNFDLVLNDTAEDGDRRPWITFVLVDLALDKFTTEFILKRRFIDSDDVKVVINGNIKRNNQSKLHKLWYFIASLFTGETQTETFIVNLNKNTHYIEFWADRMPTMNKINFSGLRGILNQTSQEDVIKEKIRLEAKEVGLDPELMISIATWESHFDPKTISSAGAKGIFQLTDITIEEIENRFGFKVTDPFDVDQNIKGATLYFKWLMERYKGDPEQVEKALAAWNWGLNNFPKDPPLDWSKVPNATKAFIKNVLNK